MKNKKRALFLFDYSTVAARPWAESCVLCYCIDVQHPAGESRDGNIVKVGADVLTYLPPMCEYVFGCAFPPCTDIAVSGARWFSGKGLYALSDSIRLFARAAQILEWIGAPYYMENPVSVISSHWRKPDYTFNPCDYGDPYTKKTCL